MSRFSPDTVLGVILGIDDDLADDAEEPYWISVRPGRRDPDGTQHATIVLTPAGDTTATETFDVQITRAGGPTTDYEAALTEYRKRLAYRRKHWTPERRAVGLLKLEQARFALAKAMGRDWISIDEADALADGQQS